MFSFMLHNIIRWNKIHENEFYLDYNAADAEMVHIPAEEVAINNAALNRWNEGIAQGMITW